MSSVEEGAARMQLDTSFDMRSDANGKDPDSDSPTLRRYHQLLWSKPLPGGAIFSLDAATRGHYLHHRSPLGEFRLSSDSVVPTFTRWIGMQSITNQFSEEDNEAFRTVGYTIGAMMVFPGNMVDGRQTVNGARGFLRTIADRMDLTLECIRRYYLAQTSPLAATLARYADFFALFEDFRGYVDFFLLQDLVRKDYSTVRFFLPFDDFTTPAVPRTAAAYGDYRLLSIEFVQARNRRIDHWALGEPGR